MTQVQSSNKPATQVGKNGVTLAQTASGAPSRSMPTQAAAVTAAASTDKPVIVRAARFPDTARIVIATDKETNPKRPGTKAHKAFGVYLATKAKLGDKPLTVAAFREALMAVGQPLRYVTSTLDWDSKHGFIKIEA